MDIDLSVLYGGSSSSTGSMSALALYKKLQQTAETNEATTAQDSSDAQLKAKLESLSNLAAGARNTQIKIENANVENDALYFRNRAATAATPEELVNDDRFLKVLADANGFSDMYLTDKQRLKDILLSDLNNLDSVARQGTSKELELAKKYNLGASGNLVDANGNAVGYTDDGTLTNAATVTTPLPAGLALLRNVTVNANGFATLDESGSIILSGSLAATDASTYSSKNTKALQTTTTSATTATTEDAGYEYDSEDYQLYINRTDVQRDVQYYKENIGGVKSLDDLFANGRLLNFVLGAYDLQDEAANVGKIRQILESDLSDTNSLANRMQDSRFLKLAGDINAASLGTASLTSGTLTDKIVEQYQELSYEKHLDEQAPGVRVALEFGRRIKDATSTYSLLGDSVLREVVTVASMIPKEIAYQDEDAQAAAVEAKVDYNELKTDTAASEKLVERYLALKDSDTSSAGGQSYLLNLFS